ncbi:hypothetical protein [Leptolyngbya sp. PCC 6406]|uniref:hypothetical protein n=1 Tax=Leptolyngbya sp. PCC 6406 TaxID=1173264 RepID=UPI0002ACCFAF|nr:hypothetical protein [Leptolyngbya sp. PCC 6406]
MNTWSAYHSRSISPQEQALYDHWLRCMEQEAPQEVIARFRALFIEGVGYPDREVVRLLDEILASKDVEQYFRYILNRCCHIMVNRWQGRPQLQAAIPELIDCFEQSPTQPVNELSRSRQARKLRDMATQFTDTEHYLTLCRLARLVDVNDSVEDSPQRPLGTLIRRYPYLYEHCLVNEESTQEQQQVVRRIQAEAQQKFEIDLSQYVTYRVRRARLQRQGQETAAAIARLRPLENPTLLSDRDLVSSLRQFSGKGTDGRSYRDSAQSFLRQHQATTYGDFKASLYEYITDAVAPGYGSRKFNKLLSDKLNNTFVENEEQPLNDFLMVRTCSQLFNFLVVDSPRNPHHFIFLDLINNLGPTLTTGVLLKLVLLCRKVKPYLERRFSILFSHYETATRDSVGWLVNMLENLNIALSLNFGSLDVSHILAL